MDYKKLETTLFVVFSNSIRKFGVSNFKKTSFFGSNEHEAAKVIKKAA